MSYGQKNYSDIMGVGGKYRISQIGCFLTSFCNLLERFGTPVDPPTLNRIFMERGIYMDIDDGIRDDLGWQSVTAYNGQIVTTVKGGAVTERNAIVRMAAGGQFGTHFSLVDSIRPDGVYIVDSWDGQVKKSSVYGPITGWAVYTNNSPQKVGEMSVTPNMNDGDVFNYWDKFLNKKPAQSDLDFWHKNPSHKEFNYDLFKRPDFKTRAQLDAEIKAQIDKVVELGKVVDIKQKEIDSLKAQVGDNSKWETLKALVRELVGKA